MNYKNINNNENGAALALVLIVMLVLSILGTALLSISVAENKFAQKQEDKLQAYYTARAGAQAIAEYLVTEQNASNKAAIDAIVGKTSDVTNYNGGTVSVEVIQQNANVIDVVSTGIYNDVTQLAKLRITTSGTGLGIFSHTLFGIDSIAGNGGNANGAKITNSIGTKGGKNNINIDGAQIDGTVVNNSSIDTMITNGQIKLYDSSVTIPPIKPYPLSTVKIVNINSNFTNNEIEKEDATFNASTNPNIYVKSILTNNNDDIKITGIGVINMYLSGNAMIKGDIYVPSGTQLHIYLDEMVSNLNFEFQGSAFIDGAIFIYGPNANVKWNSANLQFKGSIIAKNIEVKTNTILKYEAPITDDFGQTLDLTNIGTINTGYTWLP